MPCYHTWEPSHQLGLKPGLQLPCGWCIGCRIDRSRDWAIRCMHESKLHEQNCFITLTYADEHLPADRSLNHRHWQLFAKKLTKKRGPFRFYMCGEYGENFHRPHYHAILFGIDFPDKQPIRRLAERHAYFESAELSALWIHGYAQLGLLTLQSAAYVARYVMKKITGDRAQAHYTYIDEHGEMHQRKPEYNQMSRGGRTGRGLAYNFWKKHQTDFNQGNVIHNGHETKAPRYYDKLLADSNLPALEKAKQKRKNRALEITRRDTRSRRKKQHDEELTTLAKVGQLKRTLT